MAEKKKGRRAYLRDFKETGQGRYEYQGNLYIYQAPIQNLNRVKLMLWGLCILMLAAGITAGCISAPGTGSCIYVLLPYMAGLLGSISICWGLCRLSAHRDSLREYVYLSTICKLPNRCLFTIVMSGVAFLGECVFVFLHGSGGQADGLAGFLACECCILLCAIGAWKLVSKMPWRLQ